MSFAVFADFLFQTLFQFQAAHYLDCLYLVNSNTLYGNCTAWGGGGLPICLLCEPLPLSVLPNLGLRRGGQQLNVMLLGLGPGMHLSGRMIESPS